MSSRHTGGGVKSLRRFQSCLYAWFCSILGYRPCKVCSLCVRLANLCCGRYPLSVSTSSLPVIDRNYASALSCWGLTALASACPTLRETQKRRPSCGSLWKASSRSQVLLNPSTPFLRFPPPTPRTGPPFGFPLRRESDQAIKSLSFFESCIVCQHVSHFFIFIKNSCFFT